MASDRTAALTFFSAAWAYVEEAGLGAELAWQRTVDFASFTETHFLRETAWVILCSGFRESIVRRIFDHVSLSFCDWESAKVIVEAKNDCRTSALASFKNERKLDAVVRTADLVYECGFSTFKQRVLLDPIVQLQSLPYIGSITSLHLAKNLGLDVAKPDRHLVRLARQFGYTSTSDLCSDIANATGEQVKVIDLALWRFMADVRPPLHGNQEQGPK